MIYTLFQNQFISNLASTMGGLRVWPLHSTSLVFSFTFAPSAWVICEINCPYDQFLSLNHSAVLPPWADDVEMACVGKVSSRSRTGQPNVSFINTVNACTKLISVNASVTVYQFHTTRTIHSLL